MQNATVAKPKESNHLSLRDKWAVILCGGRGSRLGQFTDSIPKALVKVHDKAILWYCFLMLYGHGFRHFIFPLGYKGEMIKEFVNREFDRHNCKFYFVDTGEDTPISMRLKKIVNIIPESEDFFLLNGDTFFEFNLEKMYNLHIKKNALLTLSSVEIVSNYGIIIEENGKVVDFAREKKVSSFSLTRDHSLKGYVNAGLVWLNKDALRLIDLETCQNLEHELYPKIIEMGKAAHYKIDGNWFAIDTQKDLEIINSKVTTQHNIGEIVKAAKKDLATRYSYQTRYFSDADTLKEKILNKTIIPHQVEVQPGTKAGRPICWLNCPYCYGLSTKDSGERLPDERYVEIMKQIAGGGVKKVIFAGYITDPLNYPGIENLLEVVVNNRQIFGFHTKAIRVSDRLIELITKKNIAPMSYFSVSVDAGTNETYNIVHGKKTIKAKIYDRVCNNIQRIAKARAISGAPLDISTTYLINSWNNKEEEVLKAINDLRNAGSDLIRFTFPQVPRGYKKKEKDENIPSREEVLEYMERLTPIVKNENSKDCRVLIMDLDSDYETYDVHRSLPCFARFIFPSIGFDGWLSHCSESAAPHFRELAIGNLNQRDFWDLFYDYDVDDFRKMISRANKLMDKTGCKCDRKEHVVNSCLKKSGVFNDICQ